jgi:hypothetical protein
MSTNADAMIRAGVDAYRAGDKAKARQMLEKAIELDQYSEMAWLWLSAVVESKEEQQTCLTNVLVINPENERAKQGLKSMGIDPAAVLASAAAEPAEDEYAVPSSSSSVTSQKQQASDVEYDDWVDNLGIGTSSAAKTTAKTDDLFGDADFSADSGFDFGEDLFGDDAYADAGYEEYGDDSYADDEYADDDYAESGGDGGHYGDTVNELDDLYADMGTLEEFDDAVTSDIHDYDMDEFSGDPFAVPEPEPDEPEGPSLDELFAQIPAGIAATRLPGSVEPTPGSAYIPLAILGVLNVLAVIFIVFQLIA